VKIWQLLAILEEDKYIYGSDNVNVSLESKSCSIITVVKKYHSPRTVILCNQSSQKPQIHTQVTRRTSVIHLNHFQSLSEHQNCVSKGCCGPVKSLL
jgi:hypothetical protein